MESAITACKPAKQCHKNSPKYSYGSYNINKLANHPKRDVTKKNENIINIKNSIFYFIPA